MSSFYVILNVNNGQTNKQKKHRVKQTLLGGDNQQDCERVQA